MLIFVDLRSRTDESRKLLASWIEIFSYTYMSHSGELISWERPICLANNSCIGTIQKYYQFLDSLHESNCDTNDRDEDLRHDNLVYKGGFGHISCH